MRITKILISRQRMAAVGHVTKSFIHLVIMCGKGNLMDVSPQGFLLKKRVGSLLLDVRTASVLIAINFQEAI
ncbi:hypothetical protein GJB61_28015 [Paenibacillus sp. LC-T2]|uniref:Uncharacterized protein n=1 Tax=Paenibacillus monticola TaxID=2666075 RepID=A0A7X2L4W8_9BACL|nr:hypothetical protein [Paenibacillus monticola]